MYAHYSSRGSSQYLVWALLINRPRLLIPPRLRIGILRNRLIMFLIA